MKKRVKLLLLSLGIMIITSCIGPLLQIVLGPGLMRDGLLLIASLWFWFSWYIIMILIIDETLSSYLTIREDETMAHLRKIFQVLRLL